MSSLTDPAIRARVIAVNSALRELDQLVRDTDVACGEEDVLDRWDEFVEQFNLTDAEVQTPSPGEQVAHILRDDDWSPGSDYLEAIAEVVKAAGYDLEPARCEECDAPLVDEESDGLCRDCAAEHCPACGEVDNGTDSYCECGEPLVDEKYIPEDVRLSHTARALADLLNSGTGPTEALAGVGLSEDDVFSEHECLGLDDPDNDVIDLGRRADGSCYMLRRREGSWHAVCEVAVDA